MRTTCRKKEVVQSQSKTSSVSALSVYFRNSIWLSLHFTNATDVLCTWWFHLWVSWENKYHLWWRDSTKKCLEKRSCKNEKQFGMVLWQMRKKCILCQYNFSEYGDTNRSSLHLTMFENCTKKPHFFTSRAKRATFPFNKITSKIKNDTFLDIF